MKYHPALRIIAAALLGVTFGSVALSAAENADTIYTGGTIITMNDAAPSAEAIAVKDGKILAVGAKADVLKTRGVSTKLIDLGGKTLIPGFVDAHGHMFMGGIQALSANMLAPPDGEVKDIASLVQTLKDWTAANQSTVDKIQLIVGFGYDNAMLAELRHPTRQDLDLVSKDVPVCIIHQSGHLFAVNSKALEVCGVTADSPNPAGGVIRRGADGKEPNGVLEETAGFPVFMKLLSRTGADGAKQFARSGSELWARFGYTTAQEGRSVPAVAKILRTVADEGGLKLDVVTYPDVLVDRDFIKQNVSQEYKNRLRVGGAKLTIDGSPQGFTAWRDRPYYAPVGNYPVGYRGYSAATEEQVISAVDWAFENNVQILTHSNGESASDLLIAAIDAATRKHGKADRRAVLIHGQFLREDQIDSFNRLSVLPSLFPMHTFYWGDWHREHTVGPELVDNISPTGWCVRRGMKFTTHHDAPVAFPNSMRVLDATVTRRSRSGDIIGPNQRVDVMTALKAMTLWPAWQHFEEKSKGSLETGKLADFVILDQNPTAIDPETIDQIKIVQTIKEGVSIFDIASLNKGSASIRSSDAGNLAFARAVAATSSHFGRDHEHGGAHGADCLCGAMTQLAAIIAGAGTN
jgi:predicted amidohydrolase YtcJ